MAYPVSNDFRNKLYSGSSEFKCKLIINEEEIDNSIISSITISSPIIDTNNEFFYVGSFISQQLTIKFKNLDNLELHSGDEVSLSISQKVGNSWVEVPIGLYLIDDLAENYHKTCEIKCLDYAVKFKPNIDYSPCFVDNKASVRTILQYICDYFDVTLGECPTTNDNVEVGTFNATVSGKQWISYIAEIKGCNAKINRNGELVFKPLATTATTSINAKKGSLFELGEKYKISQVTFFDAIRNYTYGEDTDNTLFIRQDNPFVTDTSVVENIYDVVDSFEIYKLKAKNYGDFTLDAWDIIEYQVDNNTYKTINNNTLTYAMTIMGEVNVDIPSKQQEATTNVVEGNLRTVRAEVNSIDNSVKLVVEEVGDRSDKTTTIAEDINSIEAQLQTIPVITTEVEGTGALRIYNIANTRLIELKVHPTTRDILGLFASPLLKAQQGLKVLSRGITFDSDYDEKDDYYLIPKNLYFVNDVYDEFVYDGVNERMYIIHRVGINNNEKYELDEEYIEELEFFDLILDEGDYTVFMSTYPSAYIFMKAMIKNDYTNVFATKLELKAGMQITENSVTDYVNAEIEGVNGEIERVEGEVELKLNTEDLISEFNVNVNQVEIHSDNFTLDADGKITATAGDIAGFEMTNTKFNKALSGIYDYSIYDCLLCLDTYLGNMNIDNGTKTILDADNDGDLSLLDATIILNTVNGTHQKDKQVTGTFSINSDNPKNCLVIKNSNNEEAVSLGVGGVKASNIYGNTLVLADMDDSSSMLKTMVEIDGKTGTIILKKGGSNSHRAKLLCSDDDHLIVEDGLRYGSNNMYYHDAYGSYIPKLIVDDTVLIGSQTHDTGVNVYGELYCMGNPGDIKADGHISSTNGICQGSKEELKKDFEEYDNALDVINNTDIYTYRYKNEDNNSKKHIGFVIGDNYNYREEITNENNDGVDLYSFVSVCCKAIQEQQEQINELKEEINKLKEGR